MPNFVVNTMEAVICPGRQRGFVLLLILLTVLVVGGSIIAVRLAGTASDSRQAAGVQGGDQILNRSRAALLGYVVRETIGGTSRLRLGNFPEPDSLADGSYSGTTDGDLCLSNTATGLPPVAGGNVNKRCLGKIPWRDLELDFGSVDANDSLGRVPWLAISANLAFWDGCLEKLNSDVVNRTYSGYVCASTTALPYPWLTVRSETGAILSDRVAALLILPGAPITTETRTQSRTPAGPGNPADYLDSIRLPLGCSTCTGTYDNAAMNNEFIAIPSGLRYPATAEDVAKRDQPIPFNDRLIYITIDELMPVIERRVLAEMASALREVAGTTAPYKNIGYPWAAPFTAAPTSFANFNSSPQSLLGLFPFFVAESTTSPSGYPAHQSEIGWTVTGLGNPSRTCVRVQTGPDRWINTRQQINAASAANGTIPLANGSCTWSGVSGIECSGATAPQLLTSNYTLFSTSARCNTGFPNSGTASFQRNRTVAVSIDATCSSPTSSYVAATSTQPQRRTWACSSAQTQFQVTVNDAFTSVVATGNNTFNAVGRSVTVTSRYQPLMPYWFYENEWYKTAFYALSPSIAPAAGSPDCGSATTLTVGSSTVSSALVLQAGSRLPNLPATPTQTRPSSVVTDYFEGINATSYGNCAFAAISAPTSSSYNDQSLVVTP